MNLYGSLQSGGVLTALYPGESLALFAGMETPASGMKSLAFARAMGGAPADNGITFYASLLPAGSVVEIEGANENVDASYQVLATLSPDANGNASYTDIGRAAFFRAVLSTAGNTMPRVIAQR